MTTQQTTSPMLERLAELEAQHDHAATFRHADGSVTTVHYETDSAGDHDSPRDYDGNVATLISTSPDYVELDSDVAGLSEARDRWDWLGTYGYSSRGQSYPYDPSNVDRALSENYDRAAIMARYVAMFRPDVAYYCDDWSVSGYTQSDWQGGYGYVLADAMAEAFPSGVPDDYSAEQAFDAEVKVYGLHFRGDYFYAVTLSPRTPELVSETVDYAEEPVDVYGDDYSEESCYGFLGYDSLSDIAVDMAGELA